MLWSGRLTWSITIAIRPDRVTNAATAPSSTSKSVEPPPDSTVDLARCFLRLANLPNFALDRLSRSKLPFGAKLAGSSVRSMH